MLFKCFVCAGKIPFLSILDEYRDAYSVKHYSVSAAAVPAAGRILNLALTKKLTDKFCLIFTFMTYVTGQFFPYIFLAPSQKPSFCKMTDQKACGHDNLWTVGWIAFKFGGVIL